MANLSKLKRDEMIAFLEQLKQEHIEILTDNRLSDFIDVFNLKFLFKPSLEQS